MATHGMETRSRSRKRASEILEMQSLKKRIKTTHNEVSKPIEIAPKTKQNSKAASKPVRSMERAAVDDGVVFSSGYNESALRKQKPLIPPPVLSSIWRDQLVTIRGEKKSSARQNNSPIKSLDDIREHVKHSIYVDKRLARYYYQDGSTQMVKIETLPHFHRRPAYERMQRRLEF